MKKTFFSLAVCALLFAAPKVAVSADVSVDFFYNNLSGGSWIEVGDYGYCWQPDVAVGNSSWRPYSDGYWAYTDLGWTWVSYEDFGWATYHYGRWANLSDYGWVWVPGRDADLEWGPAWVSWRTGGEYIGWAPLPPETIGLVESRPLTGHLDVEFNIGPAWYNFVDVRYIGEPVLRERIVAPTQNITYIQQTVNVTNITYNNKTVYNYGPDINVVNQVAARPVQRLRLEREQNVDFTGAAKSGALTKVQGDRLMVAAPMRVTRSAAQVAPPTVKTRITAPKIERGWSAVGDERAQTEFKQRLKQQNLKNVPPPTRAGAGAAAGQANVVGGASAAPSASPAVGAGGRAGAAAANPAAGAARERAGQQGLKRERDRRERPGTEAMAAGSPAATAAPASGASAAEGTAAETRAGRGRGQGRQGNRFGEPAGKTTPAGAASPAEAAGEAASGAATAGETGAAERQRPGRQGRRGQEFRAGQGATPAGAAIAPQGAATNEQSPTGPGERRDRRAQFDRNSPEAQGGGLGQGRQGRRLQNQPAETAPGDLSGQPGGGRRRERVEGAGQGAGGGERQEGQGQGQGRQRGKQQGRGEASPASPAPTP